MSQKLTIEAFVDACAKLEASTGRKPERVVITRDRYNELVASLPAGSVVHAEVDHATHSVLPTINGVTIEIHD